MRAIPRKSRVIVLDFDATDDPIHGNQEGRFFHGDSGFCRDDIMSWIEKQSAVHYVLGLARNKRLQDATGPRVRKRPCRPCRRLRTRPQRRP